MVDEINQGGRNSFFEGTDLGPIGGTWTSLRGRTAGCILNKFQVIVSWDLNPSHNDTLIPDPAVPFHSKLLEALAACCAPCEATSWCLDAVTPAFCSLNQLVNAKEQDNDADLLVKVSQQLASGAYNLFMANGEPYTAKAEMLMTECKDSCSVEKIQGLKESMQNLLYG